MHNFAMTGIAGFVATRHVRAIKETGHNLAVALDPHDSVGRLDGFFPDCTFFTKTSSFENFIQASSDREKIDFLSICSPNFLHEDHIKLALDNNLSAICEKPISLSLDSFDRLLEREQSSGSNIYTILQLRLHPKLINLKREIQSSTIKHKVVLTYVTPRGNWYDASWKGNPKKSGGLSINIGIHLFDILLWLFGAPQQKVIYLRQEKKISGMFELEKAQVLWFLSIDKNDIKDTTDGFSVPYRNMWIDGQIIDFSDGMNNLHTESYSQILNGNGLGIMAARDSLELAIEMGKCELSTQLNASHPYLKSR